MKSNALHSAVFDSQLAEQAQDDDQRKLLRDMRRAALDTLARREHSELELRRKLDKKFGYSPLSEQVLEKLKLDKLLSDERFAESYIRYRSHAGFGPQRITKELSERGVGEAIISRSMQQQDLDWFAIARREYAKKFGGAPCDDRAEQVKRMRFLQYRGFSFDIIDQAMRRDALELETQ